MEGLRTDTLFADFFRDLAVAGRALSAYPRRHPAVAEGLSKAHSTLSALLAATGPVELAARDALLWSDRRFTTSPATQLAKLLRRRRAAGLLLDPGATAEGPAAAAFRATAGKASDRDAGEALVSSLPDLPDAEEALLGREAPGAGQGCPGCGASGGSRSLILRMRCFVASTTSASIPPGSAMRAPANGISRSW